MKKIFKRFIDVWKPSFFHELSTTEKTLKTTIGFWVLNCFVLAVIFAIVSGIFLKFVFIPTAIEESSKYVKDDMGISIINGELTTQNIENPFVFTDIDETGESYLIVIDTTSDQYGLDDLEKNDSGAVILKNKMYFKGNDKVRLIDFKDFEEDISFTFADVKNFVNESAGMFIFVVVLGIFIVIFLWFAVFRLLTALWWALILFILAMIFGSEKSYRKSYEAVLNFYFIPLVIETILFFTGLSFGFSTLVIFSIIFVVNLIWIKNNVEKKEVIEQV